MCFLFVFLAIHTALANTPPCSYGPWGDLAHPPRSDWGGNCVYGMSSAHASLFDEDCETLLSGGSSGACQV